MEEQRSEDDWSLLNLLREEMEEPTTSSISITIYYKQGTDRMSQDHQTNNLVHNK